MPLLLEHVRLALPLPHQQLHHAIDGIARAWDVSRRYAVVVVVVFDFDVVVSLKFFKQEQINSPCILFYISEECILLWSSYSFRNG